MNRSTNRLKRSNPSDDSKRSPAKRQFRNENEKRRRDLFSQLIGNLEEILQIEKIHSSSSLHSNTTNKLDKASILRETATFLREHHQDFNHSIDHQSLPLSCSSASSFGSEDRSKDFIDFSWKPPRSLVHLDEWFQIAIESLNCFFLVAKSDPHNGQIVYVSKNVSSLLDYSQDDLFNRSLFELISPTDHDRLRDYLLKNHLILDQCEVNWRRSTVDEYDQCSIIGAFRPVNKESEEKYLMSIVQVKTLDRSSIVDLHLPNEQFLIRLNLQGKFLSIDQKGCDYLGYHSEELIGQTFLNYIHPDDLTLVIRAHHLWKEMGNGLTDPYRFLTKGQQWIFFQTDCQVQINSWTGKAEFYLCKTNLLQSSTNHFHQQISSRSKFSPIDCSNVVLRSSSIDSSLSLTNPFSLTNVEKNSSNESQIVTFLSQLDNETYRINIREKFLERRLQRLAEIRIRQEEIEVIDDMIAFIDNYQPKNVIKSSSSSFSLQSTTTTTTNTARTRHEISSSSSHSSRCSSSQGIDPRRTIDSTLISSNGMNEKNDKAMVEEVPSEMSLFETSLFRSPLIVPMEEIFVQSSSPSNVSYHQISSIDSHSNSMENSLRKKDEIYLEPLSSSSLFSPQGQYPHSIPLSSPFQSYSIASRPSPLTPMTLSPFPSSVSPNNPEMANLFPASSLPTTTTTTSSLVTQSSTSTTNNVLSTEQNKSSFNRSLPHSLVS